MKFTIAPEIKEQLKHDSVNYIHIRDFISVDIDLDGSYTTDWDAPDKKVELKEDYIKKIGAGLDGWWKSLNSDGDWYTNLEGNCLNVHAETMEDYV